MIAVSRCSCSVARKELIEHPEALARAHFARHMRFSATCQGTSNEFGESREKTGDRKAQQRVPGANLDQPPGGSFVHRFRARSESARENPACRRHRSMAGRVHERAKQDGNTKFGLRQNDSHCPRT
jgi:hypothetical protein